jgi:hypothetical protein
MTELLEMEPRLVETELEEPEVEFIESWDARSRDRGRCIISAYHVSKIC